MRRARGRERKERMLWVRAITRACPDAKGRKLDASLSAIAEPIARQKKTHAVEYSLL